MMSCVLRQDGAEERAVAQRCRRLVCQGMAGSANGTLLSLALKNANTMNVYFLNFKTLFRGSHNLKHRLMSLWNCTIWETTYPGD